MSVYKRGKVYYMDFQAGGQRVFRTTGKRTKAEAEKVEQQVRKAVEYEIFASPREKRAALTLRAAAEKLWADRWSNNNRDGILERQRLLAIADIIGDKPLDMINDTDLVAIQRHLRGLRRSQATVNRYLAHLRVLLRTARDKWRIVSFVPVITTPKEHNGRLAVLSYDMEPTLLDWLRAHGQTKIADLLVVLIDTGMRLGEALALTKDNIDTIGKLVHIYPEQAKSSKPRSIPLTDRAFAILTKHEDNGARLYPFSRFHISKWFRHARRAVGADAKLTVHCLRHTFATRLINKGVDLYTVSALLGHSNITVTERYAHLQVTRLRQAMTVLTSESDGKSDGS